MKKDKGIPLNGPFVSIPENMTTIPIDINGIGGSVIIPVKITTIVSRVPKEFISSVIHRNGCYDITYQSDKHYIGSTNSLNRRMLEHKYEKHFGPIKSVQFIETRNSIDAKILEYFLIRDREPELNKDLQKLKKNKTWANQYKPPFVKRAKE